MDAIGRHKMMNISLEVAAVRDTRFMRSVFVSSVLLHYVSKNQETLTVGLAINTPSQPNIQCAFVVCSVLKCSCKISKLVG